MAKKKEVSTNYANEKERDVARKNLMRDLNKKFGSGAIKFGVDEAPKERIAFGVPELDNFTGGGIVRGNYSILWGGESSGKTSLAYHQIAKCQAEGKCCALFDIEHTFDPIRAELFGIDLSTLILIESINTAEQAMDILIELCKSKVVDYAVIDSIQAMSPKGQQETKTGAIKSVEDDTIALLARKMSQFLAQSKDWVYKGNIGVLLIGQVRTGGLGGFAPRATLSGGNALKHYSMLTLFIRRGKGTDAPVVKYKRHFLDDAGKAHHITEENVVGFDCVLKVEKQKIPGCSPEGTDIHIPFHYATGFSPDDASAEDIWEYDEAEYEKNKKKKKT